jgi:F0F1-type ATP synthase assembly protein I
MAGRRSEAVADLSAKRELNRGAGDALSMAVELAVTPAIFAFLGWRLDAWLGTTPLFLLSLFLFTMGYVVWKMFVRYDAQMRDHVAKAGWARHPRSEEPSA